MLGERLFIIRWAGAVVEPNLADKQIAACHLFPVDIDRRAIDHIVAFHTDALIVVETIDRPERRFAISFEVTPRGTQIHPLDRYPRLPNAGLSPLKVASSSVKSARITTDARFDCSLQSNSWIGEALETGRSGEGKADDLASLAVAVDRYCGRRAADRAAVSVGHY